MRTDVLLEAMFSITLGYWAGGRCSLRLDEGVDLGIKDGDILGSMYGGDLALAWLKDEKGHRSLDVLKLRRKRR